LQDPPKFIQIGIFGLKICHLATLQAGHPDECEKRFPQYVAQPFCVQINIPHLPRKKTQKLGYFRNFLELSNGEKNLVTLKTRSIETFCPRYIIFAPGTLFLQAIMCRLPEHS
jgi:hypothetical protein